MELFDVADGAGLDEFVGKAPAVSGVSLVPHLGDDTSVLGIGLGQVLGFTNRPRQGLFGIAVNTVADRGHGGPVMGVIGGGNKNDVKFLGVFLEHLTPVGVSLSVFPFVFSVDIPPAVLVNLSKRNTLQAILVARAIGEAYVCFGPTAGGHKANLKFAVLILRSDNRGHSQCRGDSGYGR